MANRFKKNNPTDVIWWLDNREERIGEFVFSFDKQTTFNLFRDYPDKLSKRQKEIFDRENPDLAALFVPSNG